MKVPAGQVSFRGSLPDLASNVLKRMLQPECIRFLPTSQALIERISFTVSIHGEVRQIL